MDSVGIRVRTCVVFFVCLAAGLSCYRGHGLSPLESNAGETTGIRGRVVYSGAWPDSTKEVRVAVLRAYPAGIMQTDSLLAFVIKNLIAFSDTLPRFVNASDYKLVLPPGTYAWVAVVWFPDIPLYLFGVKELGAFYRTSGPGGIPAPVHVIPGVMMEGINILADLNNVERSVPFFKPYRMPLKK